MRFPLSNTPSQNYKNENVSVDVERLPGCLIKLDISVSPKASKAAYTQAIKAINKEVSIPGFRKGKAPEAMVLQSFEKHIEKEWHEVLIQTSFQEALALTKLYPYSRESVKRPNLKKASKEEGSQVQIEFEAAPEIPKINPQDFQLKTKHRKEVTENDVEEYLKTLQLHNAKWEDITDRPIAEGDYVDLDIDSLDEPGFKICENARFVIEHGKTGEWLRKLVIGLTTGQTVEGVSEKEDHACGECATEGSDHAHHHHHEQADFKPTKCKITVKAVKNPVLPEFNDEFAQKVGAQNIQDLKEKVKHELNNKADNQVQEDLRNQVQSQLLEHYKFEIPRSLIEHEKSFRVQNKAKELTDSHASKEQLKEELHKIEQEVTHKLDTDFRMFFLARKLAEENNIHVQQDEIVQELMRHMWLNKMSYESLIDESMDPNEVKSRIYVNVLTQKVLNFIVEKAQKP